MKKLNLKDLELISGGLTPPQHVYPGMDARIALRTFPGIGYVVTAFSAGYAFGQWLNENTGIQDTIADILPDPSGTNYNEAGTNYNK
jgi:hypothetical protein